MLRTLYFSAFVTIYTPSNLLHSCIACHLVASCVCTDVRFGRMKQANNKNSYNMHKSVKKKKKKKRKKPKRAFHCWVGSNHETCRTSAVPWHLRRKLQMMCLGVHAAVSSFLFSFFLGGFVRTWREGVSSGVLTSNQAAFWKSLWGAKPSVRQQDVHISSNRLPGSQFLNGLHAQQPRWHISWFNVADADVIFSQHSNLKLIHVAKATNYNLQWDSFNLKIFLYNFIVWSVHKGVEVQPRCPRKWTHLPCWLPMKMMRLQ